MYAEAAVSLRDAMSRERRSCIFDGTPKEFSFAYLKHEAPHEQMEPKAFAPCRKELTRWMRANKWHSKHPAVRVLCPNSSPRGKQSSVAVITCANTNTKRQRVNPDRVNPDKHRGADG